MLVGHADNGCAVNQSLQPVAALGGVANLTRDVLLLFYVILALDFFSIVIRVMFVNYDCLCYEYCYA